MAFLTSTDSTVYSDHHLLWQGVPDVMGKRDLVHDNAPIHPQSVVQYRFLSHTIPSSKQSFSSYRYLAYPRNDYPINDSNLSLPSMDPLYADTILAPGFHCNGPAAYRHFYE